MSYSRIFVAKLYCYPYWSFVWFGLHAKVNPKLEPNPKKIIDLKSLPEPNALQPEMEPKGNRSNKLTHIVIQFFQCNRKKYTLTFNNNFMLYVEK